jgi:dGTPase
VTFAFATRARKAAPPSCSEPSVAVEASRTDRLFAVGRPDQRNDFAKDRDRILYSTALRRLGGITQVVSAAEGYVFHNRLTHTLEVAQLGRRLAEHLSLSQADEATSLGGVDPEVTEAAALAHDLGHPPFGHVAEKELDRLVRGSGINDGFEGNAQTLRTVTRLSARKLEHPGQDLTRATLDAILKYPWLRAEDPEDWHWRKFGAYKADRDAFDFARGLHPAGDETKSAEAELMDWADDIAYAVHDVEDFFRAGLIPIDRLFSDDDEELNAFIESSFHRWEIEQSRPVRDDLSNDQLKRAFLSVAETIRDTHPVSGPYDGSRQLRVQLRSLTSFLIERYFNAIRLHEPSPRTVAIDPVLECEVAMLKQLTWHYVIYRPSLGMQQLGQRRVIEVLFTEYRDAAQDSLKRSLFPPSEREMIEGAKDDSEALVRVAADTVCRMSEAQAVAMFHRISGVSTGSVLEAIVV